MKESPNRQKRKKGGFSWRPSSEGWYQDSGGSCVFQGISILISIKTCADFGGEMFFWAVSGLFGTIVLAACGAGNTREPTYVLGNALSLAQQDRRSGDFNKAIERIESAISKHQERVGGIQDTKIQLELGLLYWNIGQMEKSRNAYERAALLAGETGSQEDLRISDLALAICDNYSAGKEYRAEGKYSESVGAFENAIRIAREIGSRDHELKCLRQLSLVYWETDELEKYLSLTERALELAKEIKHKREEGLCLNNLGLYFWKKHDYRYALKHYQEAYQISGLINDQEIRLSTTSNIAIVYADLGEKAKAFKYMIEASKIDESLNNNYGLAIDMANLGINCYQIENPPIKNRADIAQQYCLKALELARGIPNKKLELEILFNLGEISLSKDNSSEALGYFQSALALTDGIQDEKLFSLIYNGLGNSYLKENQLATAKRHFEKSMEYALNTGIPGSAWESYYGLGRYYEEENELLKAAEMYSLAVKGIEESRPNISSDTIGSGFIARKIHVYERLIELLKKMREGKPSELGDDILFGYVEEAKARTFLNHIANLRIDIWSKLTSSQKSEVENISRRIDSLKVQMTKKIQDRDGLKKISSDLAVEEDRYVMAMASIESENRAGRDFAISKPIPARTIRNQLDDKTAIVEYFLGEKSSTVLFLTQKEIEVVTLPSRAEIESSIKGFIKCVSTAGSGEFDLEAAACRIYEDIGLSGLARKHPELEALVIVPDGLLYYLPFEALSFPTGANAGKYLVEQYRVSYTPSATIYYWLKKKPRLPASAGGILGFGDPKYNVKRFRPGAQVGAKDLFLDIFIENGFDLTRLPGSRKEIIEAAEHFPPDKRNIYLGARATESAVAANYSRSFQVIHFACHAFIDALQPFRSALVLSPDSKAGEDGFLQVLELYSHRIEANLVVLSACQTGRGRMETGEGILGLPRIFFYAGASSVITTLWPIGDAKAEKFMTSFYRHLAAGYSKSSALQITKIEMIKSGTMKPHDWAGFVLNGEPDQTISFR